MSVSPTNSSSRRLIAHSKSKNLEVPKIIHGDSVFDKIVRKEVPSEFIFEDDLCVVVNDIHPVAPVHFLVIPKQHLSQLSHADESHEHILGHLLLIAAKVAKEQNLEKGYRIVINNGHEGGQSVYQLHVHVIGGKQLSWPPGV
mmetsp:Transcript_18044/g.29630  ORF Transcript_18044/g.29630 Transcript_18044/m.29630 type:complete len:143 (+) Transcript_18044:128-556(+)|eukprot:CAMPEP_0184656566 /NCGR_PEP_ID=MMETSP0308-20130426/16594_1 /TAXON_ID=38269 /ORGANISM="Gloeochaete witrockiana, Strain SAG 46.84" /LENGTH=142 /DNA_ID=CAMNT_0027093743 /DNA_START=95 /DNA_END=523 /DNA_ORIENTATION=-